MTHIQPFAELIIAYRRFSATAQAHIDVLEAATRMFDTWRTTDVPRNNRELLLTELVAEWYNLPSFECRGEMRYTDIAEYTRYFPVCTDDRGMYTKQHAKAMIQMLRTAKGQVDHALASPVMQQRIPIGLVVGPRPYGRF